MAMGAVVIVTLFVGVNIVTWTGWVFFALGIEILLIWVYTVCQLLLLFCFNLLTGYVLAGYLFHHQTWLVRSPRVRQ